MPLPQWPDNLNPPVMYERCTRCGIDVSPSSTWGRTCRDCNSVMRIETRKNRCGEVAGARAHENDGTPMCDECREARRQYQRATYAKRKHPDALVMA